MDGMIEVGVFGARGERIGTKSVAASSIDCIDMTSHKALPVMREGPRSWFVVQTDFRAEEDVQEAIEALGFATYLPKMRKEVFSRKAKKLVVKEFILINRHFFAELPTDDEQWGDVRQIEEFKGALGNQGKPQPIKEADVRRFRSAEENLEYDDTAEAKIKRKEIGRNRRETTAMRYPIGARLRALSGPFGGFAGHVVSVTGRGTIKAMLELFGGMTLVEFAPDTVEPDA